MNQNSVHKPNPEALMPRNSYSVQVDDQLRRLCRLLEWQTLLHAGTDSGKAREQAQVTQEDIRYMNILKSIDPA